jgi:two-component system KDP operon response regulator KdpE
MDETTRLLLIDDDATLAEAVELYLTRAGYKVITATNGREGLQKLYAGQPDLIVLDIMMPDMDGWQVCRHIREALSVPIIMLTARGQEAERVKGLRMGADDYLVKPFSLKELEARVQAVLRRRHLLPTPAENPVYADEELVIDGKRGEVRRKGEPVRLTATERRMLLYLVKNAGLVLSPSQLLERVWGADYIDEVEYVKVYVWRLRQKIEPDPSEPRYIVTERGLGYKFSKNG